VVEVMLSSLVSTLTMVENGAEALERFRAQDFDVVLMDMQMPVMDGLTCVRAMRAMEGETGRRRTPVVMLTANALPEHMDKAFAAGADLHLSKPFTASALFETVAAAVTSSGTTAAAA
jgi:CheY-like chemotaxis protein